jgi:predicted transposase/invertase (TIGR01784 family)
LEKSLLQPRNDYVFKRIFGDPRNVEILKVFLASILKISKEEFIDLKLVDTNQKAEKRNDKLSIIDVKVELKNGDQILIELQVERDKEMRRRITFYNARAFGSQLSKGENYYAIDRSIAIVISVEHKIIEEGNNYSYNFKLYDKENDVEFTDAFQINVLDIRNLPENGNDELIDWLKFIKATEREEFEVLASQNLAINEAYSVLKRLSANEKERIEAEDREKSIRDHISRIAQAMEEGEARGKAEGEAIGEARGKAEGEINKAIDVAKKMLNKGKTIEEIAEFTDLSFEEINKLKN